MLRRWNSNLAHDFDDRSDDENHSPYTRGNVFERKVRAKSKEQLSSFKHLLRSAVDVDSQKVALIDRDRLDEEQENFLLPSKNKVLVKKRE